MKKKMLSIAMILTMVLVFGLFAMGSGSGDSSSKSDENAIGSRNNPLTVGNTMESKGLKITLNEADLNYTGYDNKYGLHTPQDGMKYVAAKFTYQNDGERDAYVSIYDFKCYADGTACQQEYGLDPEGSASRDFINTNLSPGRNVSFTTYYSVPAGAQSVELEYEANMWSDKKAYIKLQ